jgi:hypothetical protein
MATNYCVVGQGTATSGSATVTGSPKRLVPGANTVTVTTTVANQTFTVTMCTGTSASVASGTATVSGSPVNCAQGAVTTITITNVITNGTVTITVTYGSTGNFSSGYSWSSSSGGTPNTGAALSSSVSVIFDANSFTAAGQTVTLDAAESVLNMDWTGATNSPTFDLSSSAYYLSVYGNITFISAMSMINGTTYGITIAMGSGTQTLTTNGLTITPLITINGGSALSLSDTCTLTQYLSMNANSTLTTNNNTCNFNNGIVFIQAFAGRIINLGSSTINLGGYGLYQNIGTEPFTINAGMSTINLNSAYFYGGGNTFYIVNFLAPATTIYGSNTFAQFTLASGTAQTITFTDGTTQTAASLSLSGSAGNVHTLQGSSTGGWNITYTGAGQLLMDYISVSYSTASPTNTFYDYTHGTNGGNNTNWYFNAPTVGGTISAIPLGFIHGE